MKEEQQQMTHSAPSFETRLVQMRSLRQNVILIKWLLLVISITLLLIYLLTPIRDIIFTA
ncbi:MAG TPA: hypothetical protein DCM23_01910 [Firmicutes bacterium]|jgi:hypothetical protein|nr:hypothetical protein [Bacillota bacterium]